jgi:hypothetical protein
VTDVCQAFHICTLITWEINRWVCLDVFKNNARLERNLEKAKEVRERDGEFQRS